MSGTSEFFDRQYREINEKEDNVLDHSFYKWLLPFAKSRDAVMFEMLAGEKAARVIDLGCGTCKPAMRYLDLYGHYTGVDFSNEQIAKIPHELVRNPKVTIRQADLNQKLPFEAGAFDLAINISVIQYMFDPIAFVREIHRILAPSGSLLINTVNLAFLPRRLQLLFGKLPTYCAAPGWQNGIVHDFTFKTLKKLLQDSGFRIERTGYSGVLPSVRGLWPNLLASDMTFWCRKV